MKRQKFTNFSHVNEYETGLMQKKQHIPMDMSLFKTSSKLQKQQNQFLCFQAEPGKIKKKPNKARKKAQEGLSTISILNLCYL